MNRFLFLFVIYAFSFRQSLATSILPLDDAFTSGEPEIVALGERLVAAAGANSSREWVTLFKLVSPTFAPLRFAMDSQLKPPAVDAPLQDFGKSIALINSDRIAVGAPRATIAGQADAGAVYVYERIGRSWRFRYTLSAPNPKLNAGFGSSVMSIGNVLVVFAKEANQIFWARCTDANSSCVNSLQPLQFSELQNHQLLGPVSSDGQSIAFTLKSNGDRRIGIIKRNDNLAPVFSALALPPANMEASSQFGDAIALNGSNGVLLVGDPAADQSKGVVYTYSMSPNSTGQFAGKISNPDNSLGFGSAISKGNTSYFLVRSGQNNFRIWQAFDVGNTPRGGRFVTLDSKSSLVTISESSRFSIFYPNLRLSQAYFDTGLQEYSFTEPFEPVGASVYISPQFSAGSKILLVGPERTYVASNRNAALEDDGWSYDSRIVANAREGLWLGEKVALLAEGSYRFFSASTFEWELVQTVTTPDLGPFNYFQAGATGDSTRLFIPGNDGSIYAYAYNCCGIAQWTFRQKITAPGCFEISKLRLDRDTLSALCESKALAFSIAPTSELSIQLSALALPNGFDFRNSSVSGNQALLVDRQTSKVFFYDRDANAWWLTTEFTQPAADSPRAREARFESQTDAMALFASNDTITHAQTYRKQDRVWIEKLKLKCPSRDGFRCIGFPRVNGGRYYWYGSRGGDFFLETFDPTEFKDGFED